MGFTAEELQAMEEVFYDPGQMKLFDEAWEHVTSPEGLDDVWRRLRRAANAIIEAEGPEALFYPEIGTINGVPQPTRQEFLSEISGD